VESFFSAIQITPNSENMPSCCEIQSIKGLEQNMIKPFRIIYTNVHSVNRHAQHTTILSDEPKAF
jgi:hypothetical protein